MKIISIINEITNTFNETFKENLSPLNLETKIRDVGDTFTLKLYEQFLNYLDDKFKNSKERKSKYNIKETLFVTFFILSAEISRYFAHLYILHSLEIVWLLK